MAGLLGMNEPDPLTLGLLGFSQAISTPRSRGGGVAAALGAFPMGQMQAAEMQRARQQDAMRQQLMQAQIGNYQAEADMRKRRAEQEAATAAAIRQATQGAMVTTPGSLGGGVAPTSEQGRMLLEQFGDDPQFAMQGLPGLNAALNTVGPQQPVQAPGVRFDPEEFARRLEAAGMPLEAAEYRKKLAPPEQKRYVVNGNLVTEDGRPVFTAPDKPQAQTDIEKYLAARDRFPVGSANWNIFNDAARKASTHAPAASQTVYTGQVVPVEIGGRPAYVMPGKDGTVVPIPGIAPPGTQKAEAAAETKVTTQIATANRLIAKVDEALANVNKFNTGVVGAVRAQVPGTTAVDLRSSIETIRANLGFAELQAMREASPTGGALGAIAVQELNALQSTVANLDPNQSTETLARNLQQVRRHFEAWKNAVTQANRQPGQTPGATGGWSIQREQ